jgi:hypothetical protein
VILNFEHLIGPSKRHLGEPESHGGKIMLRKIISEISIKTKIIIRKYRFWNFDVFFVLSIFLISICATQALFTPSLLGI